MRKLTDSEINIIVYKGTSEVVGGYYTWRRLGDAVIVASAYGEDEELYLECFASEAELMSHFGWKFSDSNELIKG